MLAVRCAAVEFNFCSWLLTFMLSGGAGGMTNVGRVIDAIVHSSIAFWFSINSSCNS